MANVKVSSFQKKGRSAGVVIRGTKPSFQNSQLLLSSGVPSLDAILGGGFPVGSVVLIDEDVYGTFSKLLIKYFLAEGIVSGHATCLGSKDVNPKLLISELPAPVKTDDSKAKPSEMDDEMKIAWRYQNMKIVSTTPSTTQHLGHFFDLTTTLDEKTIEKANVNTWPEDEISDETYESLYSSLYKTLKNGNFLMGEGTRQTNLLRIGLLRLGSPLWDIKCLPKFLYCLRGLIRNSYATCLITMPSHLYEDKSIIEKCIHICDIAIRLESFTGTELEKNESLKEYHGFFNILKHASINSLINSAPATSDLAFRLKRKKLIIEKIHLPPELEDSTEREQDDLGLLSCSSSKSSKLDF